VQRRRRGGTGWRRRTPPSSTNSGPGHRYPRPLARITDRRERAFPSRALTVLGRARQVLLREQEEGLSQIDSALSRVGNQALRMKEELDIQNESVALSTFLTEDSL
jgi:hypothetical protein